MQKDPGSALHDEASSEQPPFALRDTVPRPQGTAEGGSIREPTSERGPLFVLVNAKSGEGDERESQFRALFDKVGLQFHMVLIRDASKLEAILENTCSIARAAEGTLVIAGGDGTINAALPYLLESGVPLGILPSGTFNYVAREYGIPLDLDPALQALVDGEVAEITVAEVNKHPFLVNSSLGLYPRLLEDREVAKRRYGRNWPIPVSLAASVGSLITRRARTFRVEMQREASADGPVGAPHELDISTLFIGNNAWQLRNVGLEHEVGDGALLAVALRKPSALRLLELGIRAAAGSLGEAKDILAFPFESLTVHERHEQNKKIKVAIDGEVLSMQGPLVFRKVSAKLRLIVPRALSEVTGH